MTGVTSIRETAGDILAEAKDINEKRAEEAAANVVDDAAETVDDLSDEAEGEAEA